MRSRLWLGFGVDVVAGRGSLVFSAGAGRVGSRCGQATKGAWWMAWHQEAMKGVGACDKPGGAGNQAVIPGSPN